MKRIYRSIFYLLVIVLLLAGLTGCEDSKPKELPSKNAFNGYSESSNVIFYVPDLPEEESAQKVLNEISARAHRAFNITLEFKKPARITNDLIKDSLYPFEKQESFDAAITFASLKGMVEKDYLLDITQLFNKNAPILFNKLTEQELGQVTFDGNIFAVPRQSSISQRLCVVVREDLVQKYNISNLNTLVDYKNLLLLLKNQSSDKLVSRMDYSCTPLFAYAYGYGMLDGYLAYKLDDSDMKLIPWEQTEGYHDYFNWLLEVRELGLEFGIFGDKIAAQGNGSASFITDWNSAQNIIRKNSEGVKYRLFPLYKEKIAPRQPAVTPSIVINKRAANPELAIKIIEWIHTDREVYDLLMYGIKDADYTIENEKVKLLSPSGYDCSGWEGCKAFMDSEYFREFTTDPAGYKDLYMTEITQNSAYLPTVSFQPQYDNSMRLNIERRKKLIPSYPDMINDLKRSVNDEMPTVVDVIIKMEQKRDIDDIVAETQKQLNEWNEK